MSDDRISSTIITKTIEMLENNNLNINDILWVENMLPYKVSKSFDIDQGRVYFSWEEFSNLKHPYFKEDYSGFELNSTFDVDIDDSLKIVGDGWWLEVGYTRDHPFKWGTNYWMLKTPPTKPLIHKAPELKDIYQYYKGE